MARNFAKGEEVFFNYHGKMIPHTVVSINRDGSVILQSQYHTRFTIKQNEFCKFFNKNSEMLSDTVITRIPSNREWHSNNGKPLIEWVREILSDSGKPMHYSEIRTELLSRGYECPIEPNEDRTPIECRIKTRIVEALEKGDNRIIKVAPATYQINE